MSEFTLDTSGVIKRRQAYGGQFIWPDLSPFAQGYVGAMFEDLRSDDPEAAKAYQEMRRADLRAGNRPLLCDCRKCLYTTAHWSRTHQWPGVCDEMRALGLVNIVSSVGGGKITEPTDLGRRVYTLLVAFSDLAPETLAAILKDCDGLHKITTPAPLPNTEHGGGVFWRERPEGWEHKFFRWSRPKLRAAFPPLTVYLGDDGKLYTREESK